MPGNLTFEQLKKDIESGDIDTVLACQVDMQGRLMGKRFHGRHFIDSAHEETHSCNYVVATDMEMETVPGYRSTGWAAGYGDYTMRPDMATLRRIPWLEATALVICDLHDHHTRREVPHAPRTVLKRQVERLGDMGLSAMMGSELEFFLFNQSFEAARAAGYRDMQLASAYNEDYHIFQTTKEEDVMRAVRNGLYGAGVPIECTKGEASAGQEEINVLYTHALECADNHSLVKNGTKEIAWSKGKAVTFMAKWDYVAAGSSAHVHQSLRTLDGEPAFHDPKGAHGMSETMRHYMAGLIAHAGEITCFLAPYINSYKRFQAGTFAPTKAVWSRDNRTAGFRICGEGTQAVRIECRIGGADLNPYLAFAAMIAAGIDGIERKLDLEDEFRGDAYRAEEVREIPKTLRAATGLLNGSRMLRDAFGEDVVDHYVHAAEWEQFEYDRRVTDWEIARGFERA